MPTVITHSLMAQDVVQTLSESHLSDAISNYPRPFFFGSQGPDFFFFYRYFSKHEGSKKIREIGNTLHDTKVNDFYQAALNYLKTIEGTDRLIFESYIAGHLCHWALDSLAHPYVFHYTGLIEGITKYDHYRFEASLDASVVKELKHLNFNQVPSYKFLSLSKDEQKVIAKGYSETLQQIGIEVSPLAVARAMRDMEKISKWLFDGSGIKTKLFSAIEKGVLKNEWLITSHLLNGQIDTQHDVLNSSHSVWSHPCDVSLVYTSSFNDIYKEAISLGHVALETFLSDMDNHQFKLADVLDDKDYSTGLNKNKTMTNFNLIYHL